MSLDCTLVLCRREWYLFSLLSVLWWWIKCVVIEVFLPFEVLHTQKELYRITAPHSSRRTVSNRKGVHNISFPFFFFYHRVFSLAPDTLLLNLAKYYLFSKAQESHSHNLQFPWIIHFTFVSVLFEPQVHLQWRLKSSKQVSLAFCQNSFLEIASYSSSFLKLNALKIWFLDQGHNLNKSQLWLMGQRKSPNRRDVII